VATILNMSEPAVEFRYPDDEPADGNVSHESALEYRLQGFRLAMTLAIVWVGTARTSRARDIRLAALRCAFGGENVNVTLEAKRLHCSRRQFHRAISYIRGTMRGLSMSHFRL
jgi:hypothetical protein